MTSTDGLEPPAPAPRKTRKADPEILAMRKIVRALRGLDAASVNRVLRFALDRYKP